MGSIGDDDLLLAISSEAPVEDKGPVEGEAGITLQVPTTTTATTTTGGQLNPNPGEEETTKKRTTETKETNDNGAQRLRDPETEDEGEGRVERGVVSHASSRATAARPRAPARPGICARFAYARFDPELVSYSRFTFVNACPFITFSSKY